MTDSKDGSVVEAYELLGRAATQFAALEFHFQFLVSVLITGKPVSIEAVILTRRKSFADKIQLLREFVPIRFPKGDPFRNRVLELAKDLDALRDERNLFIHGYWLIKRQLIAAEGVIRCSDPNWHFDKQTEEWKSMRKRDVRCSELEDLVKRTISVTDEVHQILEALKKEPKHTKTAADVPPNGGPATLLGTSKAAERPPSVS